MTTSEMRARLVTKFAQKIHFLLAAAQNQPYEEGDVCDECLVHARELAALATPSVASPQAKCPRCGSTEIVNTSFGQCCEKCGKSWYGAAPVASPQQSETFETELTQYGGAANLDVILADWKPGDKVLVSVVKVSKMVKYACGCMASAGSPKYCPVHGEVESLSDVLAAEQEQIAAMEARVAAPVGEPGRTPLDVAAGQCNEEMEGRCECPLHKAYDRLSEGYVCAALHRVPIAGCKDCERDNPLAAPPAQGAPTPEPCQWMSYARGGMGWCACGNFGSEKDLRPYAAWELHDQPPRNKAAQGAPGTREAALETIITEVKKHSSGDYNGGSFDWACMCGAVGHYELEGYSDTWAAHIESVIRALAQPGAPTPAEAQIAECPAGWLQCSEANPCSRHKGTWKWHRDVAAPLPAVDGLAELRGRLDTLIGEYTVIQAEGTKAITLNLVIEDLQAVRALLEKRVSSATGA
jgi:ribosomal protein L37AE/L43A